LGEVDIHTVARSILGEQATANYAAMTYPSDVHSTHENRGAFSNHPTDTRCF